MTATSIEIAESLCKEAIGTNSFVVEKIAAVLDSYGKEREREGYERAIEEIAVRITKIKRSEPCCRALMASISTDARSLAQKDVKP